MHIFKLKDGEKLNLLLRLGIKISNLKKCTKN